MNRTRRKRQHGFTLVEMIVATLILAIAIVGAMGAISSSAHATEMGDRVQTAALLAQRKMTELELQASNMTSGEQQGDFGEEFANYRWRAVLDTTEFDKLLKLTLTITWGESGRGGQRDFVTYLRKDADQTPDEQEQNNPVATTDTTGTDNGIGTP